MTVLDEHAEAKTMAKGGVPLDEWSGSAATDRLREVIERNQEAADRQTAQSLREVERYTRAADQARLARNALPRSADTTSRRGVA
jgi:hypothetical protein